MRKILDKIWNALTRTREIPFRGLLKAGFPAADLAVTLTGLGFLISEASLATGPVVLAVVAAIGVRRALLRRRTRTEGGLFDALENRHLLGRESGLWDWLTGAAYAFIPFLGLPTAAHFFGMGLFTEAWLFLIPSVFTMVPPGLLAAEGTARLLSRRNLGSGDDPLVLEPIPEGLVSSQEISVPTPEGLVPTPDGLFTAPSGPELTFTLPNQPSNPPLIPKLPDPSP